MPRFSIITVVLNAQPTIRQTIESVLSQQFSDFEYIIKDGGSTDGTLDVIRSFNDRRLVLVEKKDDGLYDAMNQGLEAARGEIVGFLHSDDYFVHDGVLSRIQETLITHRVDSIYADLCYVKREETSKVVREWKSGRFSKLSFLNGWMPPHPTFYVSRKIYEMYGHYNTMFHFSADYELMLRMLYRFEVSTAYLPEVIVHMRVGGKSNVNWKNRMLANREDKKAWMINGLTPRFYTLILKPIRKLFQFI